MKSKVDPRAVRIKIFLMFVDPGIQMNQKELTKAFMMISNWKKNLWPPRFSLKNLRIRGLRVNNTATTSIRSVHAARYYRVVFILSKAPVTLSRVLTTSCGECCRDISRHNFYEMVMNFGNGDIRSTLPRVAFHIDTRVARELSM